MGPLFEEPRATGGFIFRIKFLTNGNSDRCRTNFLDSSCRKSFKINPPVARGLTDIQSTYPISMCMDSIVNIVLLDSIMLHSIDITVLIYCVDSVIYIGSDCTNSIIIELV